MDFINFISYTDRDLVYTIYRSKKRRKSKNYFEAASVPPRFAKRYKDVIDNPRRPMIHGKIVPHCVRSERYLDSRHIY